MCIGGHERNCRQRGNGRLADRNEVCAGAEHLQKTDEVVNEIIEIECAMPQRDVARVVPVREIDIVVTQQRLHRSAQQSREMTRHWRNEQHARLR